MNLSSHKPPTGILSLVLSGCRLNATGQNSKLSLNDYYRTKPYPQSYTPFINIAVQGIAVGLCRCWSSISYRPIGPLRNLKRLDAATVPIIKVFDHKARGSRWQTPARSDKMEEHGPQRGLPSRHHGSLTALRRGSLEMLFRNSAIDNTD
ncbi:hypothetical protein EDD85DRAFT_452785 [Armillaria nabsnona]|nr:hypothetical protein EDD85DRAFT_452785 [Armillaria nabsnona]